MFSMGISARIVKRIITLLIVILGVVTLSFCLQIFTGTDPAEMLVRKTTLFATEEQIQAMRVELGLDGTLSEQYADYIKGLLSFASAASSSGVFVPFAFAISSSLSSMVELLSVIFFCQGPADRFLC